MSIPLLLLTVIITNGVTAYIAWNEGYLKGWFDRSREEVKRNYGITTQTH